jgi:hypothetical protein
MSVRHIRFNALHVHVPKSEQQQQGRAKNRISFFSEHIHMTTSTRSAPTDEGECVLYLSWVITGAAYRPWVVAAHMWGTSALLQPASCTVLCSIYQGWRGSPSLLWWTTTDPQRVARVVGASLLLSCTEIPPLPCLSSITRIFLSDDPLMSPDKIAIAAQLKYLEHLNLARSTTSEAYAIVSDHDDGDGAQRQRAQ